MGPTWRVLMSEPLASVKLRHKVIPAHGLKVFWEWNDKSTDCFLVLDGGELSDLAQVKNSRSAMNLSSLTEESNQVEWLVSQPKGVICILKLSIHYNPSLQMEIYLFPDS